MFVEGSFTSADATLNDENNLDVSNVSNTSKVLYKSPADLVKMLRIRGICEGNPEARLTRLLRRGKFEEAEKYSTFLYDPYKCSHQMF